MQKQVLLCILATVFWFLPLFSSLQDSGCVNLKTAQINNTEQLFLESLPLVVNEFFSVIQNPYHNDGMYASLNRLLFIIVHLYVDLVKNKAGALTPEQEKILLVNIELILKKALLMIENAQKI